MNDEMGYIVVHSLKDYPAWQAGAALRAMGPAIAACRDRRRHQRLDPHTRGIIERYIPSQAAPMRGRGSSTGVSISTTSTGCMSPSRWPRWRRSSACSCMRSSGAGSTI